MDKTFKFFKENDIFTILSTFVIGLFAHGYIFTHNLILHDNAYNFYLGATYPFGRWMIEVITRITNGINRTYLHFATPWYLGLISLFYIALAAVIVCRTFGLGDRFSSFLVAGIMVSFPMVTSLFGFMFMSAINMLGMLLSVAAAAAIIKYKKWYIYLAAIITAACATGIYQAYIATFVAFFLIYFIFEVYEASLEGFLKWVAIKIAYYGGACILTLITYLGIMKFFLWHYNTELTDYQGMSSAAGTSIGQYLARIAIAYKEFFSPVENTTRNMYQGGLRYFYYTVITFALFFSAVMVARAFRKSLVKGIFTGLMVLLIPLGVNFVYVMCDVNVHSIMMYAEVFFFIYVIVLLSKIEIDIKGYTKKALRLLPEILIAIMILLYCRFSNICYLRGEYVQNASSQYFNRLETRIESTQSYKTDMYVAFVGNPGLDNNAMVYPEFIDTVNIYPFSLNTMIDNYNWQTFMKASTGYNPSIVDISYLGDTAFLNEMPCYPDEGSIRIVEDVVVVKFSE